MTSHRWILSALFLVLTLACQAPPEKETRADQATGPPSVVLISIDTLRADRLPLYGYDGVETPHLTGLADESLLFENAYTHHPTTLVSHVSILTGRLPPDHGVRDNLGYRFDGEAHGSLPRWLHDLGYHTGASVSSYVLRPETGLGELFDFYDAPYNAPGERNLSLLQRPGGDSLAAALTWLDGLPVDEPFFLFFHLYEPHTPYEPPEPFRSRYPHPYDGEIAAADAVVGDLLDALKERGLYDPAAIILLSDHGEGLGDHGESDHGIFLYREVLRVPLLLKTPGSLLAGTRVETPVQLADVFPTVADLVGEQPPEGLSGRSLLETAGDPAPPSRAIYSETYYPQLHYGWSPLFSVVDEGHHYIRAPRPELYDLASDTGERENLAASLPEEVASREAVLEDIPLELDPPAEVDPEEQAALAALGYVGTTFGADLSEIENLPDPKDRIHLTSEITGAAALIRQEKCLEAETKLRAFLAENPGSVDIRGHLAEALKCQERLEEARAMYKEALAVAGPRSSQFALNVAGIAMELKDLDDAEAHARLGLPSNPERAHEILARIAVARGDTETAAREAALAAKGPRPSLDALVILGRTTLEGGNPEEALVTLDRAYEEMVLRDQRTGIEGLQMLRGDALRHLQRPVEAVQAYLAELTLYPETAPAYEHLSEVLRDSPQLAPEATRSLVQAVGETEYPASARWVGRILGETGQPRAALSWFERSLSLDPDAPDTRQDLGIVFLQLGQIEGARKELRRAIDLDPELSAAWNALGVAEARLGDLEGAKTAWKNAVELDPELWDALFNLGLVAARSGDLEEARRALGRYVADAPPGQFAPDIAKARSILNQLEGNPPASHSRSRNR